MTATYIIKEGKTVPPINAEILYTTYSIILRADINYYLLPEVENEIFFLVVAEDFFFVGRKKVSSNIADAEIPILLEETMHLIMDQYFMLTEVQKDCYIKEHGHLN
jgi:hypothetical protein